MHKLLVTLLGAPGSGKGTLARLCVDRLGVASLSTGDLCRAHIANGTSLGKEIDRVIKAGGLVSDHTINALVIEWFKDNWPTAKGVLLDGYPRTKGQAEGLLKFLRDEGLFEDFAVAVLNVEESVIVARLAARVVCSNKACQAVYSLIAKRPLQEGICDLCGSKLIRRADDNEDAVRERLKIYKQHLDGLLGVYRASNCRIEIISVKDQTISQVYEEFECRFGGEVLNSDEIAGDRDQE